MSVAKVVELLAEGSSVEDAIENCAKEAAETIKGLRSIYVQDIQAVIDGGAIKKYRVNCKVTFVVRDNRD